MRKKFSSRNLRNMFIQHARVEHGMDIRNALGSFNRSIGWDRNKFGGQCPLMCSDSLHTY